MIANLIGGGPMDGRTVVVDASKRICCPWGLTPIGPFYTLNYELESCDPDGLLGTFRFAGWPEEIAEFVEDGTQS